MIQGLMYINIKSGYSDDRPAWIGYVKTSKSKKRSISMTMPFIKLLDITINYVDIL